jgi:type VI secretion system protein ImpH
MASPHWGTDRALAALLFSAGWEFDFFQAVRLLARVNRERKPVGFTAAPQDEIVRFRAKNSLSFPPSEVDSIAENVGGPPSMTVTFLGLIGCHGALPMEYTEMAIDQLCNGEGAFSDFLDLFHHRLLSLFYRAWEKHHFLVQFERAAGEGSGDDLFTGYLFDLVGMGFAGLRGRLPFRDQALLPYAGLLGQQPHSASALAGILRDYFGLPVAVEQFRGLWHTLEEQDLCILGEEGLSSCLGMGALAGDAVWNLQALIRVRFGPLTLKQFQDFLPDGRAFRRAAALIRLFIGDTLDFEIQPVLLASAVPWCELTDDGAPRLGWSGWLKTETFTADADDVVFGKRELANLESEA